MAQLKPLARRFAAPVIAAYLVHLGVWLLLFIGTQVVMALLTRTVNWLAMELFGQFSVVEQEAVLVRLLPGELAEGIVPIIAGLLVGWWVLFRKLRIPRPSP
jgi:hypothetical protein